MSLNNVECFENDHFNNETTVLEKQQKDLKEKELKQSQSELQTVLKRTDYLVWWDYFMSVAYITSMRSKDPNTQVFPFNLIILCL